MLDLAPVRGGSSPATALRATRRRSPGSPSGSATSASGSPSTTTCPASPARRRAVLIAPPRGARRRTIRVGSGGVMLPNHAPLVVAEQFGMLEALHPGRIDLGIGRAPGTDQRHRRTRCAARSTLAADDFPEQLARAARLLQRLRRRHLPAASPPSPAAATSRRSGCSARATSAPTSPALLGLPFSFAHHFIAAQHARRARDLPPPASAPRPTLERPYAMIGVAAHLRRHRRAGPVAGTARRQALLPAPPERPPLPPSPHPRKPPPTTTPPTSASSSTRWTASHIVGSPETVRARPARTPSNAPAPTS